MWEESRPDRRGRPTPILRTDCPKGQSLSLDRLTDRQVSFWFRNLTNRGLCYYECNLLREECERRLLSTDLADTVGQRLMF